MIEVIKHILGLCGEHYHPSVINIFTVGVGSYPVISYIKLNIVNRLQNDTRNRDKNW